MLFKNKYSSLTNIDTDTSLRNLIQQQMNFAYNYLCIKVKNEVKIYVSEHGINPNYVNASLVTEILYDEVVRWIIFNHITQDDIYVKDKQEKLWLAYTNGVSQAYLESSNNEEIKKLTKTMDWYSEYWHSYINNCVKDLLSDLERIKLMNNYK